MFRRPWAAPVAAAVLGSALLLGPALRPGLVLAYDLGWSPDPRLTPFVTGSSMVAPRAVPSDAFAVVLGSLVGAGPAQKLMLLAILVLAALGPVRLLLSYARVGVAATTLAAVVAIWNPFVAERLAIGQWTILLGYALLGWLAHAALSARAPGGSVLPVLGWLAVAGVGGANTVAMALPVALVVLVWPGSQAAGLARRLRSGVLAVGVALGVSAVWALPGLAGQVVGDPGGAAVFRPRSDTVLGVFGSLVTGGGMWNTAAHAAGRGPDGLAVVITVLVLVILAAGVRPALRAGLTPVLGAGLLALLVVAASATPGIRAAWDALLVLIPGGGVLRDSQKLLASWVLVIALGAAFALDRLLRSTRVAGLAPVLGVAAVVLPVALQPTLAWGLSGRLAAHRVPADYRELADRLSEAEPGLVGVLPWNQYRRYPWNGDRVALSLAPRIIDQPVLQNDALPTRSGAVAGEDTRAAAVTAAIAAGNNPVAALRAEGVRYLVIESDSSPSGPAGGSPAPVLPPDAREVSAGASGTAYDLGPVAAPVLPAPTAHRAGWVVTGLTWAAVALAGLARAGRRDAGRRPTRH